MLLVLHLNELAERAHVGLSNKGLIERLKPVWMELNYWNTIDLMMNHPMMSLENISDREIPSEMSEYCTNSFFAGSTLERSLWEHFAYSERAISRFVPVTSSLSENIKNVFR